MKVHSHLQYSCSPQHFSFKSFIPQNTLCGFAKPGTYLFNQWFPQRISCAAVFQRDQTWTWTQVMKHWSIRNPILPLHQLKLSLATTKFGIVFTSLTTLSLKFNKNKEKISPEKTWLLPDICRQRKWKLVKGLKKNMYLHTHPITWY